jgi:hypothetical protein
MQKQYYERHRPKQMSIARVVGQYKITLMQNTLIGWQCPPDICLAGWQTPFFERLRLCPDLGWAGTRFWPGARKEKPLQNLLICPGVAEFFAGC